MPRGILATLTMKLTGGISLPNARAEYSGYYLQTPFVQLLPEGQMPKTSSVSGSNFAQMQIAIDKHTQRLVVSVAIDNLGKGAAAQAIHNANLMCGFDVTSGLLGSGLGA
jgi:N-acetyl-gamma-glutamyl-phosphate reductase